MRHRLWLAAATAAVALYPIAATAADTIKIGFPMPLSGPTAVYGEPVLKGAELAVAEINAKGGVLGRKFELLSRDSKASADEAVRLARELIIKNNVDFLSGTLTSAEAPAVSTIAKENKIVFIAPTSKSTIAHRRAEPASLRLPHCLQHRLIEGRAGATLMATWKDVKKVATIAPDYAYGRDCDGRFCRPPQEAAPRHRDRRPAMAETRRGRLHALHHRADGQKARRGVLRAVRRRFRDLRKQATPLGYFKAIDNRLLDGGEVGTTDLAQALGADYPYGIIADAYDPVIWGDEASQPAHKKYRRGPEGLHEERIRVGLGDRGLPVDRMRSAEGIKKAGSTDNDKVSKALLGLTFDTPVGKRTINEKIARDLRAGEFWGEMIKDPKYPFAVMKDPEDVDPNPTPMS